MNQTFNPKKQKSVTPLTYEVTLGENGRMNLPADLRQRMGIAGPGRIYIELDEDGVPTITTLERRLKRIQGLMRSVPREGEMVTDSLIADRRAEAAREAVEEAEWRKSRG